MEKTYTSLSCGLALRKELMEQLDDGIPVYPVIATEDAQPPYIVYQRTGVQTTKSKLQNGIDTCAIEIDIYTTDYASGVGLAENIRRILERKRIIQTADDGSELDMDCSLVTDCGEEWADDCYRQYVTFEFKMTTDKRLNRV